MLNFDYSIPTEIFFGKGKIDVLADQVKKYGDRVLIVYGGGSIKKIGLYDSIINIFNDNDITYFELGGVEPNPRISKVREGIKLCIENDIELVLGVGGGSSMDTAKAIAVGRYYDGDPWDLLVDRSKAGKVMPTACIPTMAATGSEMNSVAVISNMETNEKFAVSCVEMFPKFSILDPTYTFSLPKNQTASGVADIFSHIFENYFSSTREAFIQDRMAEALMKVCLKYGPIVMDQPDNYEARANIMWASSLAINGLLRFGKEAVWGVHTLEHELSAKYDITHGVGLAIITPYWMEYGLNDSTLYKFVELGKNVFGLASVDEYEIARGAIKETRKFFDSLGLPSTLREVGIDDNQFEKMSNDAVARKNIVGLMPLNAEDICNIFKMAL